MSYPEDPGCPIRSLFLWILWTAVAGLLLIFMLTYLAEAEPIRPHLGEIYQAQNYEGVRGVGHEKFHAYYEFLFNTKKSLSCCHDKDCRPTQARRAKDGGWEVMNDHVWMKVEDDQLLDASAPDSGAHICSGDPTTMDPKGRVYCIVVPPGG